ncbi:Uncharacterised protein [uncultured archaeon]|nr:Uncharacterised protein [uncultured archaeon]
MPIPIMIGKAANETMLIGIWKNPIAPKVQTMPSRTIGIGRRGHLTCLKTNSRATTISTPHSARIELLLLFIRSTIASWKERSPVTVKP